MIILLTSFLRWEIICSSVLSLKGCGNRLQMDDDQKHKEDVMMHLDELKAICRKDLS